jgi:inositol-phosphate phosphatase/L-galactose 1-phosphate phosphatase/histidinol-phosphatase
VHHRPLAGNQTVPVAEVTFNQRAPRRFTVSDCVYRCSKTYQSLRSTLNSGLWEDSMGRKCDCKSMGLGVSQRVAFASSADIADSDIDSCIDIAHKVADTAAEITSKYFRTRFEVDVKSDSSPVTIADKQAEEAMRAVIRSLAPSHSIFGEEHGFTAGNGEGHGSDYLWVLDPIDGTKSFITGKPVFGTLISLLYKGIPIVGVLDQPIQKERWVGSVGRVTTLNGEDISTRPCTDVSSAYLYATTPHMFEGVTEIAFNALRDKVRIPLYGCDCYAYGLLAAGHCDIVAEADLKPYDYMALVPIVQGAGGVITDWRGNDLKWSIEDASSGVAPIGEVIATGDAICHAKALDILQQHMNRNP